MFSKLGDLYTISIFITNSIVMDVVMAAGVEVFTAPLLSFCVSTKFKDGATATNLSPVFRSVSFTLATMANFAPGFDFFSCVMAVAALSLENNMMATVAPVLPAGLPALTNRFSHDPLHNYSAPASMKTQYISYSPRSNRS
ncbi:hypothetical protein VPH35_106167 [Triticum aestivum]